MDSSSWLSPPPKPIQPNPIQENFWMRMMCVGAILQSVHLSVYWFAAAHQSNAGPDF